MKINSFSNDGGEGVVYFEPWQVQGPEFEADHSKWYCHLKIKDQRIFEYGCPCGTCGILFRKLNSVTDRITDSEAVALLGSLDELPGNESLKKLARILEPGMYTPLIIDHSLKLINPGDSNDYFSNEVIKCFGYEPPEYEEPGSPETSYYQFAEQEFLERTWYSGAPYRAIITSVIMPTQAIESLDRERVEYWKSQYQRGQNLTGYAVSIIDNQAPAMGPYSSDCEFEEHFLFGHCLLDGHHRAQAAAELNVNFRILTFFTEKYSLIRNKEDIEEIFKKYT